MKKPVLDISTTPKEFAKMFGPLIVSLLGTVNHDFDIAGFQLGRGIQCIATDNMPGVGLLVEPGCDLDDGHVHYLLKISIDANFADHFLETSRDALISRLRPYYANAGMRFNGSTLFSKMLLLLLVKTS